MLQLSRTRLCWIHAFVALVGMCLHASAGAAPAAPDAFGQVNAECLRGDGAVEVRLDVGQATYRRSDVLGQPSCETTLTPTAAPMAPYDSVEVGEGGRAHVLHEAVSDVVLFGNSIVTLVSNPEGGGQAYPQLHLGRGTLAVGTLDEQPGATSTPDLPTDPTGTLAPTATAMPDPSEVVTVTAAATFRSINASYFLYAGEGFAWVVVSEGTVDVTGTGGPIPVPAGWQAWLEPGQEPPSPLPATRSVVEADYQGDLPPVTQLTDDFLQDDDVFATCRVASPAGADLRYGLGSEHGVVGRVDPGSVVDVSYQGITPSWLWGRSANGMTGWLDATGLGCPYDSSLLPTSDDQDADAYADIADNCAGLFNPDQADANLNAVGDACEAAAPPSTGPTGIPPLDSDGDGSPDGIDNCDGVLNPGQDDQDGDGAGDACDDSDGDGVFDLLDNCDDVANPDQADQDNDRVGDWCDGDIPTTDSDGDRWTDLFDNCVNVPNPGQENSDGDEFGDACDETQPPTELPPTELPPTELPPTELPPTELPATEQLPA